MNFTGTSGFGAVTGAASAAVAQPRVAIPPGQRRVLLRTMRCWVRRRRAAAVIALHFGGAEDRIGGRPSSIALACHAVAFMVRNGHGLRNADPARLAAACTSAQRVAAAVSAAVAAPLQRCFPVALCLQRSWLSSGRVAAVLGSVRVALAVAASVPAPRASHGPHSEEWRSIAQLRVVAAAAVRQLAHPAGWPVFANAQGSLLQVRAIVTATVAGTGGPCLDRLLCQAAAAASTQDPERSDQLRRLAPSVATAWRDHLASKPAAPPSVPQVLRVPWYAVGPTATMPAALAELASVPWAARCASVAEELRGCPTAILNLIACGHHAPDEAASNSWLAAVDSVVLRSLLAAEPEPWWQRGVLRPLLKGEHSAHCAMAGLWSRPALAAVAAAVHVEEAPRGRPSESTALSGGSVLDKFASLLRDDGPALGVVVPLATATVITAEASHAFTAPLWARWGWAVHLLAKETRSFGAVQSLLLHHPGLGHRLWSCVTGPQLTALTNLVLAGNAPPAVARAVDAAWCVALDVIGHSLLVVGDEEFTALGVPFPPPVAATAAQCLTSLLVLRNAAATAVGPHLIEARASARRTLRLLVDRHARCPLVLQGGGSPFAVHPDVAVRCRAALKATGESVALLDEAAATKLARKARGSADGREMFVMHASSSVVVAALHDAPAALPFFARLELLHSWIAQDRARLPTAGRTKVRVTVRRARCLEDGFEQLMRFGGEAMRMPFFVEFVGVHGVKEEGIDAGGVFKEFIEVLSKQAFDPAVGLFCRTDEGRIYPNPHAARLYPGDWRSSFRFIGRVLGKALYEGVVVHLPFARFVLNNLLGRGNTVDDLVTLDPAHHRALRSLLAMDDVADAGLYMSHDEDVLGETVTTDLVPGGRDIAVTADNVIRFQHSLVRHRLVDSQAGATAGFVEGLGDVLPVAWLRMFSATELQQLISGGDVPLDVTDLAAHCKYAGGYTASDRSVKLLWEVVGEMGREDQGRFLQFCTGSSCPPLLGFGALNPPFTVSRASGGSSAVKDFFLDIDRLPSASTCFNLLKLPPYMAKSNLAEKLTAAIRADSGFGLS